MSKLKIDKEKPRYKTQRQYESVFKQNYSKMLLSMSEQILKHITKDAK